MAIVGTGRSSAQSVREEVAVEMSDGITIRGQVHYPTDDNGDIADGPFPVVASFNPYDDGNNQDRSEPGFMSLVENGYIRAQFEVRGTGRSEGRFRHYGPREELDYGELIYWLHDLERSTGKVGTYGSSYLGLAQIVAARGVARVDRPEDPFKAMFPIVSGVDGYRDVLFNGGMYDSIFATFWLGNNVANQSQSPILSADERSPQETVNMQQSHLAGSYEKGINAIVSSHLGGHRAYHDPEGSREHAHPTIIDQDIPVFTIQGWNDIFQPGTTLLYTQLQNLWANRYQFGPMDPDQPVTPRIQCAIGPYFHATPKGSQQWAELWFDRFLKGNRNGIDATDTPLHLFQVYGNRWVDLRTWPLPDAGKRTVETYYLDAGRTGTANHSLNDGALSPSEPEAASGTDTLPWRLHNPCHRGTDEEGTFGLAALGPENNCIEDNRTFETATLTYTTPPFDEGRNIAGPISVSLYAATTNTNTSWAVMLTDIAPDGSSSIVSKGQLLGSFRGLDEDRSWFIETDSEDIERPGQSDPPGLNRRSTPGRPDENDGDADGKLVRPYHHFTLENEEPVEPGAVERYDITMDPILARVRPGHRLRLAIRTTASWAIPLAKDIDDVVGTYTIQRTADHASHVNIPFVEGPLPESPIEWGPCPRDCGSSYED